MAKKAVIVGWSHIPFGKLIEPDTETLMARVSGGALEHAGITGKDVDGIYVGVMNSGFQKQDFQGALVALRSEEHTSELQSLMRISYAVFCLKTKKSGNKKTIQH